MSNKANSKVNSKAKSKANSKAKSKSLDLYTDLNPKTTIHGTGFKDVETAIRTIQLIQHRSLRYQFDVINTMYNRAKYHPHLTPQMKKAMRIFAKWISDYSDKKKIEDKLYPFLPLDLIKSYEKLAEKYKVSEVARGIIKGTKTDQGFLKILKSVTHPNKLQYIPIKIKNPQGQDYWSYRISFINSRLGQMKKAKTPLFYTEGKFKGLPTKQHVILILHGYSPLGKSLEKFSSEK
jgi:hypothetical protein